MMGWLVVAGFAAGLVGLNRYLRRQEDEGDFDPASGPGSSPMEPGMRRFFDYSASGWRRDGVRQR